MELPCLSFTLKYRSTCCESSREELSICDIVSDCASSRPTPGAKPRPNIIPSIAKNAFILILIVLLIVSLLLSLKKQLGRTNLDDIFVLEQLFRFYRALIHIDFCFFFYIDVLYIHIFS